MKVKELIADLSAMDPEAEVTIQMGEGCGGSSGDSYEISGTDFWEASEKYKTPASAFIEIDKGCFCDGHRGTRIKKLGLGPQNISQYFLGLDAAAEKVSQSWGWYDSALKSLGNGKDYQEHLKVQCYGQARRALENILKDLAKMKNSGEP